MSILILIPCDVCSLLDQISIVIHYSGGSLSFSFSATRHFENPASVHLIGKNSSSLLDIIKIVDYVK